MPVLMKQLCCTAMHTHSSAARVQIWTNASRTWIGRPSKSVAEKRSCIRKFAGGTFPYEQRTFSQMFEDGIIKAIFDCLIPENKYATLVYPFRLGMFPDSVVFSCTCCNRLVHCSGSARSIHQSCRPQATCSGSRIHSMYSRNHHHPTQKCLSTTMLHVYWVTSW